MKLIFPSFPGRTLSAKAGSLAAVVLISGAAGYGLTKIQPRPKIDIRTPYQINTPYQAVLLSNGSAYFGKLEGLGTPYPVLHDVYYVQSVKDAKTKAVSNILVKRGNEWHEPDRMVLNARMIVLVEPVNPASRVAHLIEATGDHKP
jgi:hypothetical protein